MRMKIKPFRILLIDDEAVKPKEGALNPITKLRNRFTELRKDPDFVGSNLRIELFVSTEVGLAAGKVFQVLPETQSTEDPLAEYRTPEGDVVTNLLNVTDLLILDMGQVGGLLKRLD